MNDNENIIKVTLRIYNNSVYDLSLLCYSY